MAGADPVSVATKAGLAHLRAADPVLCAIIDRYGDDALSERADANQYGHYGALVRAIVGQQLSTKAAAAIHGRLLARFEGRDPTPQEILDDDPDELRVAAGLSRAKTQFLRSLAEHVLDGSLELEKLDLLEDQQVVEELTAVKGIGVWSAQMFLMFHLQRQDVLAVGDLGIRKSMMLAYELPELPLPVQMEEIAACWRPHRTLAARYLWRALDNEPS